MRGLALGGACAFSAALLLRETGSGETVMATVFLASALSCIAGFAFSAICGAMLYHLADDLQFARKVNVLLIASGLSYVF